MILIWWFGFFFQLLPNISKKGELSEWFKEHAWKVCIPQKGIEGSNPSLSATNFYFEISNLVLFLHFNSFNFF